MFDGRISTHGEDDAEIAKADRADLDAICARYDALMLTSDALSEDQVAELHALAGIFDLDANRPAHDLWPQVRAVLSAQGPRVAMTVTPSDIAETLTVLVVEDDPDMAHDLVALLMDAGHDVVGPFHSAEAAEGAAGLHAIDLALLDINLSGATDGGTLGRRLKERWGLKVIFLSGDVTAAARHADVAEAMVIKPYRAGDVLGAIQRAMASE